MIAREALDLSTSARPDLTSPAAPWWRSEEQIERRLREACEALEALDSLPPSAVGRIVAELLAYFGDSLGRILADSADYLAALPRRDPERSALARQAFASGSHRLRLARALRDLTRAS